MRKQNLWIILISLIIANIAFAEPWSFVGIADNRDAFQNYRYVLEQIRRMNTETNSVPIDFIVSLGDFDPLAENDAIYKEYFPDENPLYFPVMGNHEIEKQEDRDYMENVLLSRLGSIITRHDKQGNYYVDWKNARFIVLDQYSDFGIGNDKGWITEAGAAWLEDTIVSATNADHIFVGFHEPVFPRVRHLRPKGLTPAEINAWKMLVSHRDKVRAVFVAHTHNYSRMRVKDPEFAQTGYPNQVDGIYQIDVGNAGNTWGSDGKHTIVKVELDGSDVFFQVFQTPKEQDQFQETDQWVIHTDALAPPTEIKPSLSWRKGDDKGFLNPGEHFKRHLVARSFSDKPRADYNVQWSITGGQDQSIDRGETSFQIEPREKKQILQLNISTDNAQSGDVWTFKSLISSEEKAIQTNTETVLFPSHQSLDGSWLILSGDEPSCARVDVDDSAWMNTLVPEAWEKKVLPDYDGIAWYRLHFTVSEKTLASWGEKPLAIALGVIDDADEAFLNGAKIGQTGEFPPTEVSAWNVQRIYPLDRALLRKHNVLAVRVSDWGGGGGIYTGLTAIGPVSELHKAANTMKNERY